MPMQSLRLLFSRLLRGAQQAAGDAAGGVAGAEPPPISPVRVSFNIEHDRVVAHTETICQEIQKFHQKELWWV
jgi:hypothetical protein